MDFAFPDVDAVNARGAAPLWLRQTSAGPPQREMHDTCCFLHVVKDGTSRRFVKRLEASGYEGKEEFDGGDGTASWQSWRSGIESCTGRGRADSVSSILSDASALAMQECLRHGGEGKEDLLGRRESQRHLLVPVEQKRRIMVKPLSELADGNFAPSVSPSGRVIRRSSNHSPTSITFSRGLVSDTSSHPPSDGEVDP